MPGWLKGLSICLWLRLWSWSLVSSPILGSWWGAWFSLCLIFCLSFSLSLSLSLFLINKIVIRKTRSICMLPTRCSRYTYRHQQIDRGGKIIYHAMDIKQKLEDPYLYQTKENWNLTLGDTWCLSGWASAFGSGCDPGIPGSASLWGAYLSLCLCFCLCFSVYLSWINK